MALGAATADTDGTFAVEKPRRPSPFDLSRALSRRRQIQSDGPSDQLRCDQELLALFPPEERPERRRDRVQHPDLSRLPIEEIALVRTGDVTDAAYPRSELEKNYSRLSRIP